MPDRFYRKIIRITGADSPNVRRGLAESALGLEPSNTVVFPGVLPYSDYLKRLATWDSIRVCVSIHAQFYEGAELLMFPPEWLNKSQARHGELVGMVARREGPVYPRKCEGIGIDPAEGGDKTSMAAVDRYGLLEQVSRKTPNTDDIPREAIAFMRKWDMLDRPERVCFDRGGGGKQHADRLAAQGYEVRTVAFGAPVAPDPRPGSPTPSRRLDQAEERYSYANLRAKMYGVLRTMIDPGADREEGVFALPPQYAELRRQLAPIPLTYTEEGRLYLLPKHKAPQKSAGTASKQKTLTELIGCSPDEADSLVLAVHAMTDPGTVLRAEVVAW